MTQAAWQIMVRPLWWGVAVLGLIGVAVVLACGSTAPLAVRAQVRRALRTVGRPETTMGRILRAVLAAAVGLAAILDPLGLLEPLVALAGVVVVLLAAAEIAEIAGVDRAAADDPATAPAGGRSRRRAVGWVVGGVAVVLAVAGVVVLARPAGDLDASAAGAGAGEVCNGHAELCDRTFDDVAYLGSHNAMSVAGEPGWFLGEQADPIPVQLDQGVRALLVDVWPGVPSTSPIVRAHGAGRPTPRPGPSPWRSSGPRPSTPRCASPTRWPGRRPGPRGCTSATASARPGRRRSRACSPTSGAGSSPTRTRC